MCENCEQCKMWEIQMPGAKVLAKAIFVAKLIEPLHEKTNNLGFPPRPT